MGVCVCVFTQGWLLQTIPVKFLYAESMLRGFQNYVKKKAARKRCNFENGGNK